MRLVPRSHTRETMNQHGPGAGSLSETAMADDSTNRRVVPRFRVQFRTVVSVSGTATEGAGYVLDLSLMGCRIDSPVVIPPATFMELRIYAPELDWPLMVDGAVVQSVDGATFDLRFLRLREIEKQRLAEVI